MEDSQAVASRVCKASRISMRGLLGGGSDVNDVANY